MFKIELAYNDCVQEVIQLIDIIYKEYGEVICLDGVDAPLLDLEKNYRNKAGEFWIAKNKAHKIIGTIAATPTEEPQTVELKKLYIDKAYRGTGLSLQLMDTIYAWSKEKGFTKMILWSDTRFLRAHYFYQKMGFTQFHTRDMEDGYEPYSEYGFEKVLG